MYKVKKVIAERYVIKTSIGEGGMADVYLAEDTILNREVAIKILRGELSKDPVTLLRFQREASAISKLSHENVVEVYDVGEFEGHHYIVMEYVRGRTLKQLISMRGALDKEESVDIMIQLTNAVQHAHEHSIIHRDIKPQNVLVKDDGTVKITDFGIAIAHDSVQLTQTDAVLGSAQYLAPETTIGEPATPQVDIYALGIVFYELLTGSVPFKGDNPVSIAMKHLHDPVPSVRDFNPTLPQSIENIIIHATVKNRALRYQNTKEMLYDLEHCLDLANANVKKLEWPDETYAMKVSDSSRAERQTPKKKVEQEEVKEAHKKKNTKAKTTPAKTKAKTKKAKANKKRNYIIAGVSTVVALLLIGILVVVFSVKSIVIPNVVGKTQEEAIELLIHAGFHKDNIKIEEKTSEEMKKGDVFDIYPASGKSIKETQMITLRVSNGTFYTIEDDAIINHKFEDLQAQLKEVAPNISLVIKEEVEKPYMEPGTILSYEGVKADDKIDPHQHVQIYVTVSKALEFRINFEGRDVQEVKKELEAKNVYVVLDRLDKPEGEEEVKEGVVVKSDPEEGSWYVQGKNNFITLYHY